MSDRYEARDSAVWLGETVVAVCHGGKGRGAATAKRVAHALNCHGPLREALGEAAADLGDMVATAGEGGLPLTAELCARMRRLLAETESP